MLPQEVLLTTGAARRDAGGIYMIYCAADDKCYIGQSVNINSRIGQHKRELRGNKHHNSYLQAAWNKHGAESFSFAALENCDRDQLNKREEFWVCSIDRDHLFNLGDVGKGYPRTAEHRRKVSESLKGIVFSEERLRRMSEAKKGKPATPEKMRQLLEGSARFAAAGGRKAMCTPEVRAKMSAAHKGKQHPAGMANILKYRKGPRTPEHKAKLRAILDAIRPKKKDKGE